MIEENMDPRQRASPPCLSHSSALDAVTPAKLLSPGDGNEPLTPKSLLPAIGKAQLPSYDGPGSEGKTKVYERRNQQYELNLPQSCPQLGRMRRSCREEKGPRSRLLQGYDMASTRLKSSGSKSYRRTSDPSHGSISEEFCRERRAYFAEVDAFELQEEEEEDEDE